MSVVDPYEQSQLALVQTMTSPSPRFSSSVPAGRGASAACRFEVEVEEGIEPVVVGS